MLALPTLSEVELRRLRWRCRRGILELDIVLQRFAEHQLETLDSAELSALDQLLDFPDHEFLDIVTAKINPVAASKTPAMQRLITKLRSHPTTKSDES